ncbi:hypothetical protein [Spiroplasma endosymbiont of Amphimallon solstitiale]|uniref:hypothetical protein n=1 Tax=Spiroplasma endosymbiont of Amphimallon solstitiale TaxID=3066288 RepID=UPI00313B2DC0
MISKNKDKKREYEQRPEVKARRRKYDQEKYQKNQEKINQYNQKPEVKAKKQEYAQRPEVKARRKKYDQEWYQKIKKKWKNMLKSQKWRQENKRERTEDVDN